MNPQVIEDWNGNFIVWCIERTKREIWEEARRAKVMCGPMFTMEDLFTDDAFRERGFWSRTDHPALGEVTIPGRPFQMQHGGWELRRAAPLLGQHTAEVLREAGLNDEAIARASGGAA
jgi:crotonobetainyl-CoA:carnitine CoA-transferase CaiB-like acyl-CoA transferase